MDRLILAISRMERKRVLECISGLMDLFSKAGTSMIKNKGMGNLEQLITSSSKANGRMESVRERVPY